MTRVLIPLDGSPLSEEPLRFGLHLLGGDDHDIVLLNCIDPGDWVMPERPNTTWMKNREKLALEESRAYLESKGSSLKRAGHQVFYRTPMGKPVDEILRESEKVDVVLMCSQGRSGLKRFILGSVAEEVLRKSTCPVLVVPPRERKSKYS